MRLPSGLSLLATGSGIYWILSSQLISSFTVIAPGVFSSNPSAVLSVLIIGLLSTATGLWNINVDIDQLVKLLNRRDGWLYLMPLLLGSSDITVTLIGLSGSRGIVELNPLVATAVQAGPTVFAAFTISYLTLSTGLTLLMLHTGGTLFPSRSLKFLSLAMICGAASFGLFNNLIILASPESLAYSPVGAVFGAVLLSILTFKLLAKGDRLSPLLIAKSLHNLPSLRFRSD